MAIQWPLAIFTTLAGTGAWLLIFAMINFWTGKAKEPALLQRSLVIGFVIVAVGGLASVFHLSHPENIVGALNHPTSDIFLEILGVAFVCLFVLILFFMGKRGVGEGAQKGFGVLVLLACVYLSFVSGYGYVMAAQPYWNTLLMPAMYMATAALSGATLFMLVVALSKPKAEDARPAEGEDAVDAAHGTESGSSAGAWLFGTVADFDKAPIMKLMGVIAAAIGVIALVIVVAYAASTGVLAVGAATGPLVVVIAGVAISAVCGYIGSRKTSFASTVSVAFVCGFIGCLMVRVLMFTAGVGTYDFFAQNFFAMI